MSIAPAARFAANFFVALKVMFANVMLGPEPENELSAATVIGYGIVSNCGTSIMLAPAFAEVLPIHCPSGAVQNVEPQ